MIRWRRCWRCWRLSPAHGRTGFATEGREKGAAEGLERGLERERKLLLRLARVRFGDSLTSSMATLLEPVTDADRLEEIGEWLLLVCDSGEALLARLRQA